ncbi:hypothetical protein HIM_05452 [Hirsutella minnesotensis 3608]|uniref:Alpha/beta hydrolase fold-3 domain-containing protein n=1 Tax=Hirsutella minnesotensis 3608 TaxID=1043627 RepID=A0A0F7ZUQ2_9HYPO|nr:hypothetical protein HIM_05452 [Hirsutella minnesotensis 3608]
MAPVWSSQPFKALYTVFVLLKTPPTLLLLFVRYLVTRFRPSPEWSIKTSLVCAGMRALFQYVVATRSQLLLYAAPDKAKDRHTRIRPHEDGSYHGVLSACQEVRPSEVDAVWFPGPPPTGSPDAVKQMQRVVLHFPGGAFVMAFGHTDMGQDLSDTMAKHLRATNTVWAQYRLSGSPGTCFPAALQDALTFYRYILSLGVPASNVILSGDSAGGNIAIALLRYLETGQAGIEKPLPTPGGVVAFSPWVHVTRRAGLDYTESSNSDKDMLVPALLQWGAEAYLPDGELSAEVSAYVSPLGHPFRIATPLFIHAGTAEAFHRDIQRFAGEMTDLNGGLVEYNETAHAPHNLLLAGKGLGLEGELAVAVDAACEFLEAGRNGRGH